MMYCVRRPRTVFFSLDEAVAEAAAEAAAEAVAEAEAEAVAEEDLCVGPSPSISPSPSSSEGSGAPRAVWERPQRQRPKKRTRLLLEADDDEFDDFMIPESP